MTLPPFARVVAAVALTISVVACPGCKKTLRPETYDWQPALKATEGRFGPLVSRLSLGEEKFVHEHHPTIEYRMVFTNADELAPFLSRQRRTISALESAYEQEGVTVWLYLALTPLDSPPVPNTGPLKSTLPGALRGSPISVAWKRIDGADDVQRFLPGCRGYDVVGEEVGPGGGQIEYFGVIGISRNLIVELVSQVAPSRAEDDPGSSNHRAVETRRRAALARIKRMYDGLGLAVCSG
jgi:hypothetical protein